MTLAEKGKQHSVGELIDGNNRTIHLLPAPVEPTIATHINTNNIDHARSVYSKLRKLLISEQKQLSSINRIMQKHLSRCNKLIKQMEIIDKELAEKDGRLTKCKTKLAPKIKAQKSEDVILQDYLETLSPYQKDRFVEKLKLLGKPV